MNQITVLNVNDDEATRYAITQVIKSGGYRVWEAASGREALELARKDPDIIVLDIQMPDIDGIEVCRRLKTDPRTSSITVIHLTANRIKGTDRAAGLDSGADGYLMAPVSQAEILATLKAYVRMRRAESAQRFLAQASSTLMASLDVDECFARIAEVVVPFLGEGSVVHRIDENGAPTLVATAPARPPDVGPPVGSVDQLIAGVLRSELPQGFSNVGPESPHLSALSATAGLSAPLIARGRLLGVLTAFQSTPQANYDPADLLVMTDLADRAATALDNARLYEQAQRAIRIRDNVLAVVSHDLKNPLNNIVMASDLLVDQLSQRQGDATALKQTRSIQRAARNMNRLIGDLLDLASVDAGQLSMDRRPVAASSIISQAVESHLALAEAAGVRLESEMPAESLVVDCDDVRVQQVIGNLISNAVKHSAHGSVTLSAARLGAFACFTVRDTGAGISEEHLPRLFEPFWQASKTARVGTGLGLSISKGIVDAHGGEIHVESRPGAGSTFAFTLPLASSA